MPSYNPYRKVIDTLMPKITKGLVYLDELETAFIDAGILGEDHLTYENIPKRYLEMVARDRAMTFKKAFESFKRHLAHYELVCVGERASRFKTRIALGFEPLKENTQEKMRDDAAKYVKAYKTKAKIITETSTYNENDAKELDERNNELVKFVEEKGKMLKAKYSKKLIQ